MRLEHSVDAAHISLHRSRVGTFFPGELTNHVSPELVSHAWLGIVTGLLAVVVATVVAVVVVVVAIMLPNRSMRAIIIISTAKAVVLITLADFTSCTNYWQMYLVALITLSVGTRTSSLSSLTGPSMYLNAVHRLTQLS